MTTAISNLFRIQVVPSVVAGVPGYISDKPMLTWFPVPNSDIHRYGNIDASVAAGIMGPRDGANPGGTNIGFGRLSSMFGYSGGAKRRSGSWVMLQGNGGSLTPAISGNGWRGNSVEGISLAAESPTWETLVPPANFKRYWARSDQSSGFNPITGQSEGGSNGLPMDPANPAQRWIRLCYLSDRNLINLMGDPPMPAVRVGVGTSTPAQTGDQPNNGHTYSCCQFIDGLDTFIRFGTGNMMEGDEGQSNHLDSWTWAGRTWQKKGFGSLLYSDPDKEAGPQAPTFVDILDGGWTAQDYLTGDVYFLMGLGHHPVIRWKQSTAVPGPGISGQTEIGTSGAGFGAEGVDFYNAQVAIGTIDATKIFLWRGYRNSYLGSGLREYDVTGASLVHTHPGQWGCTLTGPEVAGAFPVSPNGVDYADVGGGLIWSELLQKFLLYRSNGVVYTLQRVGVGAYYVDRLSIVSDAYTYASVGGVENGAPLRRVGELQLNNRFWEFPDIGVIAIILNGGDAIWLCRIA